MITARKIQVTIVSNNRDEDYRFIRNEMREQNKALNVGMNHLYFNYIARQKLRLADLAYQEKESKLVSQIDKIYDDIKKAKTDEKREQLKEKLEKQKKKLEKMRKQKNNDLFQQYQQIIGTSEQTSVRDAISEQFNLMSDTKDRLSQKVTQDFKNDIKAGLLTGERVLRTYKKDNPLYIRGRSLNLCKEEDTFYFKWIKGIVFQCVLGIKGQNKTELYKTLERVLDGNYKICDSALQFNKNNKLILILTLDIPDAVRESKIEGRVVGVDLGLKIPAYCSLNDDKYPRLAIGDIKDFLKVRTSLQRQYRSLQRALKSSKGGKGRYKKLKALDRFREKEKNYVTTYNHFLSREIVKFARKYRAEQINLELLSMAESTNKSVLRNWSYYQLQQFIEYKAAREGIKVKYVDPYRTSKTCSECGHFEEGQRTDQAHFTCKQCGFEANADYNAARNVAKSTKFITTKEQSEYYQKDSVS
ncbi:RNA-guided endonuclease TnpB family protein [Thermoactinomyces sp. CICC 10522]|uniref:RNA-guided endonuclease TnpB family protein n=1 Tax=Thermoactinomyces sp. CICC 10522 TaxID=2767427 RepID=UPI0018DD6049|nr:RNA-guided endonuclease TnpB family protein [Thermoactinomyces sp. CICC 10522]MBH8605587.1 transposase [Thermoactinomyces sp. CICC 10522]